MPFDAILPCPTDKSAQLAALIENSVIALLLRFVMYSETAERIQRVDVERDLQLVSWNESVRRVVLRRHVIVEYARILASQSPRLFRRIRERHDRAHRVVKNRMVPFTLADLMRRCYARILYVDALLLAPITHHISCIVAVFVKAQHS